MGFLFWKKEDIINCGILSTCSLMFASDSLMNKMHHSFTQWFGTEKVPGEYLKRYWPSSFMHICVTMHGIIGRNFTDMIKIDSLSRYRSTLIPVPQIYGENYKILLCIIPSLITSTPLERVHLSWLCEIYSHIKARVVGNNHNPYIYIYMSHCMHIIYGYIEIMAHVFLILPAVIAICVTRRFVIHAVLWFSANLWPYSAQICDSYVCHESNGVSGPQSLIKYKYMAIPIYMCNYVYIIQYRHTLLHIQSCICIRSTYIHLWTFTG